MATAIRASDDRYLALVLVARLGVPYAIATRMVETDREAASRLAREPYRPHERLGG